jgi:hypothetical protein
VKKLGIRLVSIGVAVIALFLFGLSSSAMANSVTVIDSFDDPTTPLDDPYNDPRSDLPKRGGTLYRALYGPYHIPAASGGTPGRVHNQFFDVPAPCQNCRITDMAPNMRIALDMDSNGTPETPGGTANLNNGLFLHHFVLFHGGVSDLVCPSGLLSAFGERFAGAGNERSHLHLPDGYGYTSTVPTYKENVHLENLSSTPSAGRDVYIEMIYRTQPLSQTQPVRPLWLDIDGCGASAAPGDPFSGDSEYPAPVGHTDVHRDWTNNAISGRVVDMVGHIHDIDYETPGCVTHCGGPSGQNGGLQVTAELLSGPSSMYFGPSPLNWPSHTTGARLCRSEGYYGTSYGLANGGNGHLDTTNHCGTFQGLPPSAFRPPDQPQNTGTAYPRTARFPALGVQLNTGQTIRLHSEYHNEEATTRPDVMGIMMAWVAPRSQQYAQSLYASLVPAFRATLSQTQCQARGGALSQHGAPLSFDSCNPPAFAPGTVAHMGSDGEGWALYTAIPGDLGTGATDEADVWIAAQATDIRSGNAGGVPYNPNASGPDVTLLTKWRLTDNYNGPSLTDRATVADFDFGAPVDCAPGTGANGSTCSVNTSADAQIPGAIKEGKAMNIQLARVRLNDSGNNGVRGDNDDRFFATQGIYNP